jgi:hypothetical protein
MDQKQKKWERETGRKWFDDNEDDDDIYPLIFMIIREPEGAEVVLM